jgi:hypothetical protein
LQFKIIFCYITLSSQEKSVKKLNFLQRRKSHSISCCRFNNRVFFLQTRRIVLRSTTPHFGHFPHSNSGNFADFSRFTSVHDAERTFQTRLFVEILWMVAFFARDDHGRIALFGAGCHSLCGHFILVSVILTYLTSVKVNCLVHAASPHKSIPGGFAAKNKDRTKK